MLTLTRRPFSPMEKVASSNVRQMRSARLVASSTRLSAHRDGDLAAQARDQAGMLDQRIELAATAHGADQRRHGRAYNYLPDLSSGAARARPWSAASSLPQPRAQMLIEPVPVGQPRQRVIFGKMSHPVRLMLRAEMSRRAGPY